MKDGRCCRKGGAAAIRARGDQEDYRNMTISKITYHQKTNMLQKQPNQHALQPQQPADLFTFNAGQSAVIGLLSK